MSGMKVNFNNVRKQACLNHDRLIDILNESLREHDGQIVLNPEDVEAVLNNLRSLIGTIAMTYIEGDDDFKDMYEPLYPEPESMAVFNQEDET